MFEIKLSSEQKAMLVGWLGKEEFFLIAIESIMLRVLIPRATGSMDSITSDLSFIKRLKLSLRQEGVVLLSGDDIDTLIEVAHQNTFTEKEKFWQDIIAILEDAIKDDTTPYPLR